MDKKNILIVENNWQDRALMNFMLKRAGYSVLNVLNQTEAIRDFVLHQDSIALIVLGTPNCTDLLSFAKCVLEVAPHMPILSKAGEPLNSIVSSLRSTNRLRPLSLMVRVLRALEGQADSSEYLRNDLAPQHSFPSETNAR